MNRTITVGDVSANPGEVKEGYALSVELRDGSPIRVPVIIMNGKEDGPHVVIVAGTHPTELVGVAGVHIIAKKININDLKGSITIFPLANPLAMQFGSYVTPHDGVNLSTAYPGSSDGGVTSRFANLIWETTINSKANLLMDFHENVVPCLSFSIVGTTDKPETDRIAVEAAEAFGITVIRSGAVNFGLPGTKPGDMSITKQAMREGIPAFTPEFEGTTQNSLEESESSVSICVNGILNTLRYMKMLDGTISPHPDLLLMKGDYMAHGTVRANKGGIIHRTAPIATKLQAGTKIATVYNVFGKEVETIEMPIDGYLWGWIPGNPAGDSRNWTVQSGSPVGFIFKDK
mgnify:CR=1 FL=1